VDRWGGGGTIKKGPVVVIEGKDECGGKRKFTHEVGLLKKKTMAAVLVIRVKGMKCFETRSLFNKKAVLFILKAGNQKSTGGGST